MWDIRIQEEENDGYACQEESKQGAPSFASFASLSCDVFSLFNHSEPSKWGIVSCRYFHSPVHRQWKGQNSQCLCKVERPTQRGASDPAATSDTTCHTAHRRWINKENNSCRVRFVCRAHKAIAVGCNVPFSPLSHLETPKQTSFPIPFSAS